MRLLVGNDNHLNSSLGGHTLSAEGAGRDMRIGHRHLQLFFVYRRFVGLPLFILFFYALPLERVDRLLILLLLRGHTLWWGSILKLGNGLVYGLRSMRMGWLRQVAWRQICARVRLLLIYLMPYRYCLILDWHM